MTAPLFQDVQTGSAGASSGSVASASVTNTSGHRYLMGVCWRRSGGAPTISSVAGMGLTWNLLGAECGARDQLRLEVYEATGDGGSNGAVTVTFGADTNGAVIAVARYSASDGPHNLTNWNTVGEGEVCTGGTDNNDCTGTLTADHSDTVIVGFFATRNRTMSATSGWNVRVNDVTGGAGGDLQTLSVEDKADTGTVTLGAANNLSGTADWALIGVEMTPTAAAATAVPNALMMVGSGT